MDGESIIEVTETHTVKVVPVTRYEVQHSSNKRGVSSFGMQFSRTYGLFEDRADAETVAKILAASFEK